MSRKPFVSRRSFLKTAAAACAVPTVLPASVFGADGATAPSDRVTLAFIGCGRQGHHKNIPLFVRTRGVQALAVCDVDSWRLDNAIRQIKAQYDSRKAKGRFTPVDKYVDYRDVLARDDVQAVVISTPDHWHTQMALDAMRAGKDVALEKPITRTVREGQQLIEAAKKHGRVFRVDSEFRSLPQVQRAATLVRNGYIGRVRKVTACVPQADVACPPQPDMPVPPELDYERWQGPAPRAPYTTFRVHTPRSYERPGWMRHLYYCDGMITNWGTHINDGAMWATATDRTGPVEVEATGEYPGPESFWNVLLKFDARFRFAGGLEWVYRTEKQYFLVEGDEGWVRADFQSFDANPKSLATVEFNKSDHVLPLKSEKQDFIDRVRSRGETLEPPEVGHRVTSLGHLAHIAIQVGGKLQWDPAAERFTNSPAANAMLDKPIHAPKRVS